MRYWIIRYTKLYQEPKVSNKICDIPSRIVVTSLLERQNGYHKIQYRQFTGWVREEHIEPFVVSLSENVVQINNPTPAEYDAPQYVVYNGTTQFNMCGQLCVAYVFRESSLETFLEKWKNIHGSYWKQVFGTGKARGTSVDELVNMTKTYPSKTIPIQKAMDDSVSKLYLLSPVRLSKWLEDGWKYIAGVKISNQTGVLQQTGILHWVCIDRVFTERFGGMVEMYNPFPNAIERYSWNEFLLSAGVPYGILVKPL
jgi:hypothetical protein